MTRVYGLKRGVQTLCDHHNLFPFWSYGDDSPKMFASIGAARDFATQRGWGDVVIVEI